MPRTRHVADPAAPAVPAVERAVAILGLLAAAPPRRFPLAEVARSLDLPKSTALNLCQTLERAGLLRRSHEGYQLGRRLVQLGADYVASVDPVREFYEACRVLPAELGVLVQLSVLDEGMNAVFLAREDLNSGLRLGLTAEIGRRVPAPFTASGKAMLAALPEAELERRLAGWGAPSATARSPATTAAVREAVRRARADGIGRDDEETLPGIACVGMALPTSQRPGDHVGISLSADAARLTGRRRRAIRAELSRLAEALAARL